MITALLALTFFPRVDAQVEVAHDLGLNEALRGTIIVGLDLDVIDAPRWALSIWTGQRTYVRENREDESPVRISPAQIHYPVGARLELKRYGLGLFAFHQSNHDIDTNDPVLNKETLSYEWYGIRVARGWGVVMMGVCYDRGTRLGGRTQLLPFDYYYAAARYEGLWAISEHLYARGRLMLTAHEADDDAPSWLDWDAAVDLGARQRGPGGEGRVFLRLQRVEGYQHLADDPEHMALVGLSIGR